MPSKLLKLYMLLACLAGVACGGGPEAKNANDVPREVFPLRRRLCEGDDEKLVDVNGDGRANLRHVYRDGKETCAEIDMNLDGRIDVTRVFDDGGQMVLEQHDFDFDGRLDQQVIYEAGAVVRKEVDTNFDKMVDTWIWCDGSFVKHLERDRRHTGFVDTWEDYESGNLVAIRYDANNDGEVERWEQFRQGHLYQIQLDEDLDGKPDAPITADVDLGGPAVEAVSCDGNPIPQIESGSTKAVTNIDSETKSTTEQQMAEDEEAAKKAEDPDNANEANLPDPSTLSSEGD